MAAQSHLADTDPPPGGSLALLTVPYVFTQDELLGTDAFIKQARKRGHQVDLDLLQKLHECRLLVPLYRVSDTAVEGRRVDFGDSKPAYNPTINRWVTDAALDGRLRDPAEEGYSAAWPYRPPAGERHPHWWNGFVYSSWQLSDVDRARHEYAFMKHGQQFRPKPERLARDRRLTLVLAALAPRYLPGIVGRVLIPAGLEEEGLLRFRADSDVPGLLRTVGFDEANLRPEAETLLLEAQSEDPLADWIDLMRHARFSGWSKLKGAALDAMWRRVAAEILLRAHEDLAAAGHLDPLPDVTETMVRVALHDRLTPRHRDAPSLEYALGTFGLSPHPRVILLVEGETELRHLPRLLAEFGLTEPQQVRVQMCKGSGVGPQLIARYGVTPRIGRRVRDTWTLDATPTALVIAMDPENRWATPEKRAAERKKLQDAIREEVRLQGADIGQDDLDFLVRVHVWGEYKYELANFTDDELVPAITLLATNARSPAVASPSWEQDLRDVLKEARAAHIDIGAPLGRLMRRGLDKPALADILWPVLLAKCEREWTAEKIETPVLKVAEEVFQVVGRLSGRNFVIDVPKGFDGGSAS